MNIDAYDTGYDAYWDGADLTGNPYDPDTEQQQHQSWDAGWRKAREHDYDESEG